MYCPLLFVIMTDRDFVHEGYVRCNVKVLREDNILSLVW